MYTRMAEATPARVGNHPHANSQPARKSLFASMYAGSRWLTVTGWLMLADIILSIGGLLLDPATVDGSPAWLKPLKFGISTSLFSFTVAFMIGQMDKMRAFARVLGALMAIALTLEIVLIDMQAARHVSSHFNFADRFDATVFQTMGAGIAVVFLSTSLLFVFSCLQRLEDRSLAWAIRLGLLVSLAGMATGFLMTLPTPDQLAIAHHGGAMPRIGAHTVGAPDGGPNLRLTGWSADHGDLRIAHFIGLHCMQAVLFAWWLTQRRMRRSEEWSMASRTRLVFATAICWILFFDLVLWQALRGQAFLRPDLRTWLGWSAWLCATLLAALWIRWSANQSKTAQRNPALPGETNAPA